MGYALQVVLQFVGYIINGVCRIVSDGKFIVHNVWCIDYQVGLKFIV